MAITLEVRVFHGLLEPLEPIDLPEGTRLKVIITGNEDNQAKETEQTSKWARLAEEMRRESPLRGHSADLLKLIQEFREDFTFRHDE
ncbi:MAG: antitoxin family protein [Nitrospirae bacterium]|nr:antitoxin family protein [Nitrospirota bacterium]